MREITANTAVRGLYLYRLNRSQTASINVLRPYSAYNIPITRTDPGPDGVLGNTDDGGKVVIWDYDPAYRGAAFQGNQVVNRPEGRDDRSQSFEVALNRRLASNFSLSSSFTKNMRHNYVVAIAQSPNDEYFPLDTSANWLLKASGTWNGPRDIVVGVIMEGFSGPQGTRTYIFRAAGEAGGTPLRQLTQVNMRMEESNSQQEKTYGQMNLRFGKKFRVGSNTIQTSVDALNIFNTNAVKEATYVSGPQYANVTNAVGSRQLRCDIKFQF